MIPEAIAKYSCLEQSVLSPYAVDPEIMFCDYIDRWLEQKKGEVKKVTYEGYAGRVSSMKLYFEPKKYKLKDITPHIVDTFYKWCLNIKAPGNAHFTAFPGTQ